MLDYIELRPVVIQEEMPFKAVSYLKLWTPGDPFVQGN